MDNTRIKYIADNYGYEIQSRQLQEECAELIASINQYSRKNYDSTSTTYDHLTEEIADVAIMLDQVIYLLGCKDKVDVWRKYKVERQLERIEGKGEDD